jgi:hypothetical protein
MAAAFSLEPPNQDSASASKSDKLLSGQGPGQQVCDFCLNLGNAIK